jgi:hypothetical protein
MTMALDVVACLGLATDDARAMNFAGLCCLVRGSVIGGAPRAIRKGRRLSGMLDELGGRIRPCTHEDAHPSRRRSCLIREHLRWSWHLRDFAPQCFDTEAAIGVEGATTFFFDVCDATSFGPYCGSYHRYVADDDYARYSRFADQKRLARAAVGRLEGRTSGKPSE